MKVKEKFKNIFSKGGTILGVNRKVVGVFALAIGNLSSVFAISIAWFGMAQSGKDSDISMVSGDVTIKVKKVTAFKYVYPYYRDSTTFIDYDTDGSIKRYVLEDHTYDADLETKYDEITVNRNDAVVTLGDKANGTFSHDGNGDLSATYIHYPHYDDFRYYLVGDSTFCGDANHAWSTNESISFENKSDASNEKPIVVENVLVSAGSNFILFDRKSVSNNTCKYLTYSAVTEDSPFKILGNGTVLKCVRSGVYDFSYNGTSISITKKNTNSAISNNSLDTTLINFTYDASEDIKETYGSLGNFMPVAVNEQNTMLILDVELDYQNVNAVQAGLKIERDTYKQSSSVMSFPNKYSDADHYKTDSEVIASDFFSFYSVFSKTPYDTTSSDPDENELWSAMHKNSNLSDADTNPAFAKFNTGGEYEPYIDCRLHNKTGLTVATPSDLTIPASSTENIYHCYIGIEYDYQYVMFFTNEYRLGKTYTLSRDFTFYFTGTQVTEN